MDGDCIAAEITFDNCNTETRRENVMYDTIQLIGIITTVESQTEENKRVKRTREKKSRAINARVNKRNLKINLAASKTLSKSLVSHTTLSLREIRRPEKRRTPENFSSSISKPLFILPSQDLHIEQYSIRRPNPDSTLNSTLETSPSSNDIGTTDTQAGSEHGL